MNNFYNPFASFFSGQQTNNPFESMNANPFGFDFNSLMNFQNSFQDMKFDQFLPNSSDTTDFKALATVLAQMIKTNLHQIMLRENTFFFQHFEQPVYAFLDKFKDHPLAQSGLKEGVDEFYDLSKSFFAIIKYRQELMVEMEQITHKAIDVFLERAKNEDKITSLQKLYLLWSTSFDEMFKETSKQDKYVAIQAQYTNTVIKAQSLFKDIQSKMLKALHIPSYKELDSVNNKLHNLSQEVKELKKQLAKKTPIKNTSTTKKG